MASGEKTHPQAAVTREERAPTRLQQDLAAVLNRHSRENASSTPDFLLGDYLVRCLEAYEGAQLARANRFDWPAEKRQPYVQAMLKACAETLHARDEWHGPEAEH